jgi:2-dehydropantoate 2-reductase
MKICVIGAGAIGGLISAYFKKAGRDIFIVAKPEQIDAIKTNGLKIQGIRGDINVDIEAKEKLSQNVDLVILAVKTQDIEEAIEENKPFITNTKILTMQNGIKAEEILTRYVEEENIFSSIVMFGATYLQPAKIVHNFEGDLIIGKFSDQDKGFLNLIKEETQNSFETKIVDNIKGMKWTKLFINMNNCLPAILGKSIQETFQDLDVSGISINLWKEAKGIIDRLDIKLENLPAFPVERITGLLNMPQEKAASIYSGIMTGLSKEPLYGSILQSIKRGRDSEIDYINGEIVNLAHNNNLKAPLNEKMVSMVHQVEKTNKFFSKGELLNETKGLSS